MRNSRYWDGGIIYTQLSKCNLVYRLIVAKVAILLRPRRRAKWLIVHRDNYRDVEHDHRIFSVRYKAGIISTMFFKRRKLVTQSD